MRALARNITGLGAVALLVAGCGARNPAPQITAEQLQQSFQKAEAPIVQEVAQASAAVQVSNFPQAVIIMNRVAQAQPLNPAQVQAVDALLVQTRKAIERNPKLDSPQLYQAMAELLVRAHGEN
jgi:hypothetical protein